MQLSKAGSGLFKNPQFITWTQYADNLRKTSEKETSAISTLATQYGDNVQYKMIENAKAFLKQIFSSHEFKPIRCSTGLLLGRTRMRCFIC
ncbi:hypothetical protein JG687_00007358 [Phytophthora cactorum]|uniref:Uncharacterized protein n=1 Tax=Phytophthora cactorum TaxID=29920 RepID=A0A8T1UII1_9STRA|nr:hypothetical protein JG687_00007358 [Phytophthora cactorum]